MFRDAIVLAAGEGLRMRPLTYSVPKALAPTQYGPFLERHLTKFWNAHIPKVHVTTGYLAEQIYFHFATRYVHPSSFIDTNDEGTAYWLMETILGLLPNVTLVTACDVLMEIDLAKLWKDSSDRMAMTGADCMVVQALDPSPLASGDWMRIQGSGGVVVEVADKPTLDDYGVAHGWVLASGVFVICPDMVREMLLVHAEDPESIESMTDVYKALAHMGRLRVSPVLPTKWRAIDSFEQLQALHVVETAERIEPECPHD